MLPLLGCAESGPEFPPDAPGLANGSDLVRDEPREGSAGPPEALEPTALRAVFLGTSLTEGYGLANPEVEAWPARIGALAAGDGIPVRVVNAGSAGETSAGAVRRLAWVLQEPADLVVIETGANDGLRALPVSELEANLDTILAYLRDALPEARVAVVQMEAPPNLGPEYSEAFRAVYGRVATRWDATLIPFPLEGVAGVPSMNQGDGIHPTAQGHRLMAESAWPTLRTLFQEP